MTKRFVTPAEMLAHVEKDYTPEQKAEAYRGGLEGTAEAHAFTLGWTLRELRLAAGMTQMELSEKVGIQQREITRIENGQGNPTLRTMMRLLLAFNKTIAIVDYEKQPSER